MLSVSTLFARPGLRAAAALPAALILAGAPALAGPAASAATAPSATVSVSGTQPAWAVPSARRGPVAAATPVATTVYLAGRAPAGLTAYAQQVSEPGGADYHKYLTPSQFEARYGATSAQIAMVEQWLRSAGLRITSVGEHAISADGTAAQTEQAYGTPLNNYLVQGRTYRAPDSDARIPARVASAVLAVSGLDDMPITAKPTSLTRVSDNSDTEATRTTGSDGSAYLGPSPCSTYYGQLKDTTDPAFDGRKGSPYAVCGYVPSQLRSAYGVTASGLSGKGATVAIVDAYASPTMEADADQYAANHGDQPFAPGQYTETVTPPSQWTDQSACGGVTGWAAEEHLDVEAVHAMAPSAGIHYYGANSCDNPDFLGVFTSIVDNHSADLVSDSWGSVIESNTGNVPPSVLAEYTQIFEQGAIEGIGFTFGSGDCGAEVPTTACGAADASTTPQANFPASDAWVTAVGGTSLAIGRNGKAEWNTGWGTDAWALSSNGSWQSVGWQYGSGGGTSAYVAQPWYQQGVVPEKLAQTLPDGTATATPMRVVPDVAMDADPTTGFLVGITGLLPDGSTGYFEGDSGGTSLACPLFAGLEADAIQGQGDLPIGFANPAIYANADSRAFTDITATSPGTRAVNMQTAFDGYPATSYTFGDDGLLKASRGYDDVTGVGTPSAAYLQDRYPR